MTRRVIWGMLLPVVLIGVGLPRGAQTQENAVRKSARVLFATPEAVRYFQDGASRFLVTGDRLIGDGRIETASNGRVLLELPGGDRVRLFEDATVALHRLFVQREREMVSSRWNLLRGLARFIFDGAGEGDHRMRSGDAVAGVRGTVLEMGYGEDAYARFAVHDGSIDVTRPTGAAATVRSGTGFMVAATGSARTVPLPPPPTVEAAVDEAGNVQIHWSTVRETRRVWVTVARDAGLLRPLAVLVVDAGTNEVRVDPGSSGSVFVSVRVVGPHGFASIPEDPVEVEVP